MGPVKKMLLGVIITAAGVAWYVKFWKELLIVLKGSVGIFLILLGFLIYLIGKEEKLFEEEEKRLEEELKKEEERIKKEQEKEKKILLLLLLQKAEYLSKRGQ